MTGSHGSRRVPLGAEVALGFTGAAAAFAVVAVTLAVADSGVVAVVLGAVSAIIVAGLTRSWGVAYAVPVAIAGLVAFDWYQFPPTHPEELPDAQNLVSLFVYLAVGSMVGELAACRTRRAEISEAARAELAAEQVALRRVATLVAKDASPADVLAKVAEEAANVLGDVDCALVRDAGDGTATIVATWGAGMSAGFPVGTRLPVDGDGVLAFVLREARQRRIDDYSAAGGAVAEGGREYGIGSAVGCPIVVRGGVWGAMVVARFDAPGEPIPPQTEARIEQFADLAATAIANAEARAEVARLADEQAALRRVATQVAEGAAPTAVFDAVTAEMERLLDADEVTLSRYEAGRQVTVVAHRGSGAAQAPATAPPTDVRAPVVVDGRLWGVMIASWTRGEPPPSDTEARMAGFAELLDTAIANADSRDQLTASRARLLTAGDEARRRVVRDLHDGAQQRLVHTVITLKLAQRGVEADDGKAGSLISEALEHAREATAELRELAHGILPASLMHGGLRRGVLAIVERLDLPVGVDVPAERFPAEVEANAYFIVAEALTNVVKHSHARRAAVRALVEDRMLRVEVRDDGVGGADPEGRGLVGISDRATALGGWLEIESLPSGGTRVAATLPLSLSVAPQSRRALR